MSLVQNNLRHSFLPACVFFHLSVPLTALLDLEWNQFNIHATYRRGPAPLGYCRYFTQLDLVFPRATSGIEGN